MMIHFRPWFSVLLLLMAGCATPPATPAAPAAPRETAAPLLRIGTPGLASDLVPRDGAIAQYQYWFLYDNLTQFGPNYEVRPSLAEKWDLSADGLSWTFTIRSDVKWPDGSPLTANDVAFTVNQLIEKNWPVRSRLASTTGAAAPDAQHVVLSTRVPDMSVPNNGGFLWVIPKAYVEQIGGVDAFLRKPIGSGPYELVEFAPADHITYRKRAATHAFRKAEASEVIIRSIPDNGQLVTGLRTGEIDLAPQVNFSIEQVTQLKAANMTIVAPLQNNFYVRFMWGAMQTRHTPLEDKRVRQAINYAIDRATITKQFFGEYGQPSGQLAAPGSLYYDSAAKPWPYDVAVAKRLLTEAGYPNGFKLPQGLDFTPSRSSPQVMLAVKSYLQQVGIEFELNSLEVGIWSDRSFGRNNQQQPDLLASFTAESDGFFTNQRVTTGCNRPAGTVNGQQWYCNPEWDRLYDASLQERDTAKRSQLLLSANRLVQDDVGAIFIMEAAQFTVFPATVRGVEITTPQLYHFDAVRRIQ